MTEFGVLDFRFRDSLLAGVRGRSLGAAPEKTGCMASKHAWGKIDASLCWEFAILDEISW
jgi:hypothetical protein